MSLSRFLSAAEQRAIISTANVAVSVHANSITAKLPNKYFFTKEDIEDLAGEVIYRACRSFDRFDSKKSSLKTWVSRIALNCVKDALDYRMKRIGLSEPMFSESSKDDDDDEYNKVETSEFKKGFDTSVWDLVSEYSADKDINRKEFEEEVMGKVGKLSDKNQKFFSMLVEEELTPKEMAEREGCTANAASKRIWDIRQALKAAIAETAREFGLFFGKIAC
jgi:RNA polymerase sigma factor (sigma-70 family)